MYRRAYLSASSMLDQGLSFFCDDLHHKNNFTVWFLASCGFRVTILSRSSGSDRFVFHVPVSCFSVAAGT